MERGFGLPEFAAMLGMCMVVAVVLLVLIAALTSKQQKSVQKLLIEKFGTGQELLAFTQTEAGQRFVADIAEGGQSSRQSILRTIRSGVIITLLGLGMLVVAALNSWWNVAVGIGLLLVFLGAGLLIAAAVSWRVSKAWGLLRDSRA